MCCSLSGLSIFTPEIFTKSVLFGILSIGGSIGLQIQTNHVKLVYLLSYHFTRITNSNFVRQSSLFIFNKQFSLCLYMFKMSLRDQDTALNQVSRGLIPHSTVYILNFVLKMNSFKFEINSRNSKNT